MRNFEYFRPGLKTRFMDPKKILKSDEEAVWLLEKSSKTPFGAPSMSKVIVTTTINAPTEALRKFAAMPDWELVVVGDKKTPTDFHIDGASYGTPE